MTIDSPTPDQFVEVVKVIEDFWLTIVKLPLGKREMSDKHTKILLIEDSPIYTRLVQKILTVSSQIEYQIECVDRLSTGLEHLVKGEIDSKTLWRVMQYAIERKWAEDTLRKSEEKYHTLYESSKDGIVFFGMHGNLLEANPAF